MNEVVLDRLAWVIMAEFQKRANTILTFSSIYRGCQNVAFRKMEDGRHIVDPESPWRAFEKVLFDEIRWLGNHGYVAVHSKPGTNQVSHLIMLDKGKKLIGNTVFLDRFVKLERLGHAN